VCVGLAGQNVPIAGLGLVLAGLGLGAFTPSASALASKQSLPSDRGAVMGTYQASTSLARAIGPYAAAFTYAGIGVNAPFLTAACLALPAAWLVWNVPRRSLEEQPDALTAGSRSRRS